jgi:hypothetical protein
MNTGIGPRCRYRPAGRPRTGLKFELLAENACDNTVSKRRDTGKSAVG